MSPRALAVALCLVVGLDAREVRSNPAPFGPGGAIRYAAKTQEGAAGAPNADYFALVEDEQSFVVTNGSGAAGAVASKRAAEAFHDFYSRTRDVDATWPYSFDVKLSYIENRLVGGLKWANAKLYAAHQQRATAVAAVVSGGKISIGHVGNDRAYLIRDGKLQLLTQDHTMLEEYRRDHPDASSDELSRIPRQRVLSRALGRRPSVAVDIATTDLLLDDRILLCSEGVVLALDDRAILEIMRAGGMAKADLEVAVATLIDRARRSGSADVTVILLGFVAKHR